MKWKEEDVHIFARLEFRKVSLKPLVVRDKDSKVDVVVTQGTANQIEYLLPLKCGAE